MVCYPNLIGEMAKREITKKSVAKRLGISERALHNKLSGAVSFAWEEVMTIKICFFPDIDLQQLFTKAETNNQDSSIDSGGAATPPEPV